MPLEFGTAPRIAIVGSGAAGLAAAYELSGECSVTIFEAENRIGGHARSVMAGPNRDVCVDTGFIVFNKPNYPHLNAMFDALGVPVAKSNMGFSASVGNGAFEYGLQSLRSIAAQKRNLANPKYWRMIWDIIKFMRQAEAAADDPDMSVGEFLDHLNMGEWFRRYYLLPISGAIWSSTPEQMTDFPAKSLVQFFRNHSLLSATAHQWYTVDGGSIEYVTRISRAIEKSGGIFRLNAPVQSVKRAQKGVSLLVGDVWEDFDQVVMACHADQSLGMLEAPDATETDILGSFKFQGNSAVLHGDARMMPKRRAAWASWVFRTEDHRPAPKIGLTYWMNSLQNINDETPMFLSLNPSEEIDAELVYDRAEFRHPVFNAAAIKAQPKLADLQGVHNSWYCGAWTRWGFHEDAYGSGVEVAAALRAKVLGTSSTAVAAE